MCEPQRQKDELSLDVTSLRKCASVCVGVEILFSQGKTNRRLSTLTKKSVCVRFA